MAVIQMRFFSQVLGFVTAVRVIVPTGWGKEFDSRAFYEDRERLPVLWLLHGGSDNYTDWHGCTTVQLLADEYQIAVVMPDAQNSSYSNMAFGPDWFDYMTKELPEFIYRRFPVSRERGKNFIAGMSMGGFGTLKIALRYPERFLAACPIASAVQLVDQYVHHTTDERPWFGREFEKIFGHYEHPEELLGSEEDCYFLLERAMQEGRQLPALMMAQGTEDFTYQGNKEFYEYATGKGCPIRWVEAPGVHDWNSWNLYLPMVFAFIREQTELLQGGKEQEG